MTKSIGYKLSIIFLCFSVFIFSYRTQRAEAFLPILLNPYTIGALAALAGAGVAVAQNPKAAKAIASDFINGLSNPNLKDSFFMDATKSSMIVTAAMWTELKTYVNKLIGYPAGQTITYGTTTQTTSYGKIAYPTADPWLVPNQPSTTLDFDTFLNTNSYILSALVKYPIDANGGEGTYQFKEKANGFPYTYEFQLLDRLGALVWDSANNTSSAAHFQLAALADGTITLYREGIQVYQTTGRNYTMPNGTVKHPYLWKLQGWQTNNTGGYFNNVSTGLPQNVDETYTISQSEVYTDNRYTGTSWDLTDRTITAPKDVNGNVIATPEDWVGNPSVTLPGNVAISEPIAGAGAATQTGLLTSILTGISTMADTFTHPIGDTTKINWDRLKLSAAGFTTAFPFSLPWDIGRAWTSVFGGMTTGDPPVFTGTIAKQTITIEFPDVVKGWLPFARAVTLAGFDIALIYSVRKLLGGAS